MNKTTVALTALTLCGLLLQAPASATASPAPAEDPAITARVQDWLRRVSTGEIDRSQLSDSFSSFFTAKMAAETKNDFAKLGTPTTLVFRRRSEERGVTTYTYAVTYPSATVIVQVGFDGQGKIDGFGYGLAAPPSASPSPGVPGRDVATSVASSKTPGALVVVADHGKIVYERAFGVRSLETRQPVDAHTRFEIGSVTKQFTAAAILQLKERGRLKLSDRLGQYLPQYGPGKDVTIEQLLWQVSGIPDYTGFKAFWKILVRRGDRTVYSKQIDLNEVLSLIKGRPLRFKPGSKYEYSNTNYYFLGIVVAAASGMTWQRYVRTHIFAPAGMSESTFTWDEAGISDMATGYGAPDMVTRYGTAPGERKPMATGPELQCAGDGAIVSTGRDMVKWDAALFGGKIISAADLALMTTPGLDREKRHEGYGFGWAVDSYDGVPRLSHGGGTLGFTASNQVYPTLSQYVVVLTNADWVYPASFSDAAFEQHNPRLAAKANADIARLQRPAITALAKKIWHGVMTGSLDRTLFTPRMLHFMASSSRPNLREQFAPLGDVQAWIFQNETTAPHGALFTYRLLFANGEAVQMRLVVTPQSKVSGLLFMRE